MTTKITTNNIPRQIVYGHELSGSPLKQARADHDYLEDFDSERFVLYRGCVHHLSQFERFGSEWRPEAPPELARWHGIHTDGMSTGTLIRLSDDGETAVLGSVQWTAG